MSHAPNHIVLESANVARSTRIPVHVDSVTVLGWAVHGDGHAATYEQVTSAPSHAYTFTSADGAIWERVGPIPGIANKGDAAATLSSPSPRTQFWITTLTEDRAVTLATAGFVAGDRFRIVRTAAGAFNLNVGTGPLKALAANTWCEVEFNGTAWALVAYGAL